MLLGFPLGMVQVPLLKFTCNPSSGAVGRDKDGCAPLKQHVESNTNPGERAPRKKGKATRPLPRLATQRVLITNLCKLFLTPLRAHGLHGSKT